MRSQVGSSGPATFFCGSGSRNHFYGHSHPSTDSSRAVVSYWRKDVHIILVNCLVKSVQEKCGLRLTDSLNIIIVVHWDVKLQHIINKIKSKVGYLQQVTYVIVISKSYIAATF